MNTLIETLNHWGQNALTFAWPMLWQSSLLIIVVAALDFLLARKIRAAIRHALWLVILVKLLLPPALALPTGVAWWLWPAKPPLTPLIQSETVSFDTAPPEDFVPQTAPIALPPPKLNGAAWALLLSGAMSAGLFAWLALNWLKVTRKTHRSPAPVAAPCDFASALEQARQLAGLRGPMRLRLVNDTLSPALYGLFRPVILLPRALGEKLSAAQLRAVLVHEAVHLRRGDVWVNCAQTLLQIAYWWHPLLWLANARIRRLREEAVDDAVMLALRGDAEAYAPTLLEVAKFAFRRPLASLGLVGILESRSALRQRVERLVDFRPPRRAGVTFLSLLGVFLFSAVALPMGQAPVSATDSVPATPQPPLASAPPRLTEVLIEGRFLWMQSSDVEALTVGLPRHHGYISGASDWMAATNAKVLAVINQRMRSLNLKPLGTPRIVDISGNVASIYVGTSTNWYKFNCTPVAVGDHIDLSFQTEFARVSSSGETNRLEIPGQAMIDDGGGIVLCAPDPDDASSNLVLVINVKTIEPASAQTIRTAMVQEPDNTSRWPDPNFEGIRYVNLWAQFLIAKDSQLRAVDPALIDGRRPKSFSAGEVREILAQLENAGARVFCDDRKDGIHQPPVSGGYQNYSIGSLDGAKHVNTVTALTEDLGGSATNVLCGYNIDFSATQPDWTPMDLTLRALTQADGTFCQMDWSFPNVPDKNRHAAINLPDGGALIWAAESPTVSGEYQVVLLLPNSGNDPAMPKADTALSSSAISILADSPDSVAASGAANKYEMRTFKINPGMFYSSLREALHITNDQPNGGFVLYSPTRDVNFLAKNFFKNLGVNMDPPKTLFFNDRLGVLFVYATPQDLDVIEPALGAMIVGPVSAGASDARQQANNWAGAGQISYEAGEIDEAERDFNQALDLDPGNKEAQHYLKLIQGAGAHQENQSSTNIVFTTPGREAIYDKMNHIHLDTVSYQSLPLSEVIKNLWEQARLRDPDKTGINFLFNPNIGNIPATAAAISGEGAPTQIDPNTGLPLRQQPQAQPVDDTQINITLKLKDVSLVNLLDAICLAADHPIKYSVEDYGIIFSPAASRETMNAAPKTNFFINPTNVLDPQQSDENHYSKQWAGDSLLSGKEYFEPGPPTRVSVPVKVADLQQKVFYVSTAAFYAAVHRQTDEPNGLSGFKEIIANAGVDLSPPKAIFISEGTGGLFVYATTNDIAIIKGIIDGFDCPPAQVHIKARFIEIPQKAFAQLQEQYLQQGMSNGIARLTNPQFQVFLYEVQQQPGTEELAEPEVTTLAGRQTQMRTTITQSIVTDFTLGAPTSRHAPVDPQIDEIETSGGYFYAQHHRLDPQITQLETGPMLDVIALAPADGYTLSLQVTASDTQFFGYASPKGLASHTVTNRAGDKVELPVVLPEVQLDQASVQQVSLYDGQSMVLFPQPRQETFTGLDDEAQQRIADGIQKIRENNGNKVLIAVVTATFIDRAGNRVHSDDQIPFAQTQLPPPWP
jgi:beta-lactamase regulating signal transducer with metallopeptidase domain/tetratricopeptide (TPR) repeat protein